MTRSIKYFIKVRKHESLQPKHSVENIYASFKTGSHSGNMRFASMYSFHIQFTKLLFCLALTSHQSHCMASN